MAGAIINDRRPDLDVVTAGTLTVDGQPISFRTREALKQIGLQKALGIVPAARRCMLFGKQSSRREECSKVAARVLF